MEGKRILIGVCGSIAAYKSAHLVRLLIKSGAEVKVVLTDSAKEFITPLTLSTLSKNPVASSFVKNIEGEWENHVELGLWADLIVVAPASANSIAKFANGICDNLLTAVYLSAKCHIMVAPAMDLDMFQHPSTQQNLTRLVEYGNHVLDTDHGELASGLVGQGRMAEPEVIFEKIESFFEKKKRFEGKKVLVTAGPTHEKLDPVRFIGNHSSGKMGLALVQLLKEEGADVKLIAGPSVPNHLNGFIRINTESAEDMYNAVSAEYDSMDLVIFAAAVADYRPAVRSDQKIKKSEDELSLTLVKNKDIAMEMGKRKSGAQFHVGFALETQNEAINAQEKMKKKNFDMIVLNSLNDKGAGFSVETNKITIFHSDGNATDYPLKGKDEVAGDIVDAIYERIS